MYLRYRLKMKHHISYFYNALLEYYPCIKRGVKYKVHQVQRKQIDSHTVCSKCPPLVWTQARKRVGHWSTASSISDCSKPRHTCSRCLRSSSMSWTWQWRHVCVTYKTRHRASTSMYLLTFCVRVMSPERHHWKPAVQAATVMLRTPPSPAGH